MSFENNVKQWVSVDNKIRDLTTDINELRKERNNLTENINEYVSDNDLKKAVVNISDGKLKFQTVKETKPLTLRYINSCLSKCIVNEDNVNMIMDYIINNRESKYNNVIKRTYNKES